MFLLLLKTKWMSYLQLAGNFRKLDGANNFDKKVETAPQHPVEPESVGAFAILWAEHNLPRHLISVRTQDVLEAEDSWAVEETQILVHNVDELDRPKHQR